MEASARKLLAYEAAGFEEWGASAGMAWNGNTRSNRGLSVSLRQHWGGAASGGTDALFAHETLDDLSGQGAERNLGGRLEGEMGYGMRLGATTFVATPYAGFGLAHNTRDYRVEWRLASERRRYAGLSLGAEAVRNEQLNDETEAEHAIAAAPADQLLSTG